MAWLFMAGLTLWLCVTSGAAVSPVSPATSLQLASEVPRKAEIRKHASHSPMMRVEQSKDAEEKEDSRLYFVHSTGVSEKTDIHEDSAASSKDKSVESDTSSIAGEADRPHHPHSHHRHHKAHHSDDEVHHHDDSSARDDGDKSTSGSAEAPASTTGASGQDDAGEPVASDSHKMAHEEDHLPASKEHIDKAHQISDALVDTKKDDFGPAPASTSLMHYTSVAVDAHGELAQLASESEFLPALGMNNPNDLAYRALDMMMGIASILPEDYPFVCICLNTGLCEEEVPPESATPCPSRKGQKAGAFSTGPFASLALVLIALSSTTAIVG